jgi:hypothetical protein
MAKTKQSGSAVQRRAQERQQRQRREETRVSTLNKGKGPTMRKKDRSGLYMIVGVLTLIVALVIVFVVLSRQPAQSNSNPNLKPVAADATVVQLLTGVSQSTWETVGTGGLPNPFQYVSGQPPLKGPHGHPQFFYVGAEYCPNCAAERWAMINALSRFGTFSKLSQMQSFENNISTFSFVGSSYTSQYVDFVPREILGNSVDSSGQSYVSQDKLTAAEQQNFTRYNSGQTFPFANINNTYILTAASYNPQVLLDGASHSLSWQTIVTSLTNTKSPIAQGILGTANYMTAAICSETNQQPGSVCNSAVIQQIEHGLKKTSQNAGNSPVALAPADLRAAVRRVLG